MIPEFKDDHLRRLFEESIGEGKRVAVLHKSGHMVYRREPSGAISATPLPPYIPPYDCCMIDDDGLAELRGECHSTGTENS